MARSIDRFRQLSISLAAVAVCAVTGCGGSTSTATPTTYWATYEIDEYRFDVERLKEYSTSIRFQNSQRGSERTGYTEIKTNGSTVLIENGKLSVNEVSHGEVTPSDVIRIALDGKVNVQANGRDAVSHEDDQRP